MNQTTLNRVALAVSVNSRSCIKGLKTLCGSLVLGMAFVANSVVAAPLPTNNFLTWLRADIGVSTDGAGVTTWADQATTVGGANNAVRVGGVPAAPAVATGIGGLPTISFNGASNYLQIASNTEFNTDKFTWFIVAQADAVPPAAPSRILMRSNYTAGAGAGSDRLWGTFSAATTPADFTSHARDNAATFVGSASNSSTDPTLFSARWGTDNTMTEWLGGTAGPTGTGATATPTNHQKTVIGADSTTSAAAFFNGDISEILIYNIDLNQVNRRLIENYLSAKYSGVSGPEALPLSNDLYAGDTVAKGNYDREVFGIGREADGAVTSRSDDLGLTLAENLSGPNAMGNGDYALAGHALITNGITSADLPAEQFRWQRSWFIQTTGDFSGTLTFDFSDAAMAFDANYNQLLYRENLTDDFVTLGVAGLFSGDQIAFNLQFGDLPNGYFTLGTAPVPEPTSLALVGMAALGLVARRRRNGNTSQSSRR